jgi:glutamine---fructose-6-phosphate transaminase (isomerizing)
MCGIVGYIGHSEAADFLITGLRRLEYRGYDSAGVATIAPSGTLALAKSVGRIDQLEEQVKETPIPGQVGIGHTRWATHGSPTLVNAHPHLGGMNSEIAVVHNGVIENFQAIRTQLESEGYEFHSQTDSEVIAHLISRSMKHRIDPENQSSGTADGYRLVAESVADALAGLRGTFGLAVLFVDYPELIIAARRGSPLIVGVGQNEHFIASDTSPLAGRTDQIVYLHDHELAVITADSLRVMHRDDGQIDHNVHVLELESNEVETGGFEHYMLKEIFEQPESIANAMRGRLDLDSATAKLGGLNLSPGQLHYVDRILMTACGTSWHAALVGEYQIESLARMPVDVEYASELRYRNPPLDRDTLLFALTQSGETADTLAALREIQRKGHPALSICNVIGSSIANEADGGVYLHAGPEIGVASTKAFTSQCVVTSLLSLYFGRLHHLSYEAGLRIIEEIQKLPDKACEALKSNDRIREIAQKYADCNNFLYLGRQYNFPTALEGALKLKEISYIHAEGYPAAEMKHGPIALVDSNTPSVFLMPQGPVYDKVMANLQEIKARGGPVIAVVSEGDCEVEKLADEVIKIPEVEDFLSPIISIIPLQLLAYHIAVARGCDVDKPRNLAKSVTVE